MANIEFSDMQKDAIGEILNISMGSAATAVSGLLSAKVWITTPRVEVMQVKSMDYNVFEPAVCVKIVYVKGLVGSNLMVLKQADVQLILAQLMGQPLVVTDDFEFDELNISAVSEVMNQMMGASATALSDFLGYPIDISTPTPYIMSEVDLSAVQDDFSMDEHVIAVTFNLSIDGVIKSEFVSVMGLELARTIANKMLGLGDDDEPIEVASTPIPEIPVAVTPPPPPMQQMPQMQPQMQQMPQMPQMQQMPQMPQMQQMPMQQQMPPMQQMMPQDMGGAPYGYPQQPYGYGYPPPYGYGYPPQQQPINVQNAQLHQFESFDINLSGDQKDNLQLLLGVPLQISVEIGTAKRKVKDILEFSQGTIIELERQAGAPVDVVVNGNLIARGDVVVVDDNFAVRITEIIKSKFMDSLGKE